MVPYKTQHTTLTFLLTNSAYPWKLLVGRPNGSLERMNDTKEALTKWLEQVLLKLTNMKTDGGVQH